MLAQRLNAGRPSVALVLLLYAAFIFLRLATSDYDPSVFIHAGDWFTDPDRTPRPIRVAAHAGGYDGQAYYRLALNPLTSIRTDYGITLDNPAYRQQRILYPLLTWVFAFGQPDLIPVMLIAINFVALGLLAIIGGQIARSLAQPAYLGLVFPLYPGFLVSLDRDLTEIVAGTCLLGSLLLLRQRRYIPATIALTFGVLARETVMLTAITLLLVWLAHVVRRRPASAPWYVGAVPLVMQLTWQLALLARWSILPLRDSNNMKVPLQGFATLLALLQDGTAPSPILSAVELPIIGLFCAAALLIMRHTVALPHERLACLLYMGLVFMLNQNVWLDTAGLLRAFTEAYLFGAILLLGSRWPFRMSVFAAMGALWILLFVWQVQSW